MITPVQVLNNFVLNQYQLAIGNEKIMVKMTNLLKENFKF